MIGRQTVRVVALDSIDAPGPRIALRRDGACTRNRALPRTGRAACEVSQTEEHRWPQYKFVRIESIRKRRPGSRVKSGIKKSISGCPQCAGPSFAAQALQGSGHAALATAHPAIEHGPVRN